MKLYAARASDFDDLVALWPHCDYASPDDAAAALYAAYAHLEVDPHLADFIRELAAE